MCGFVGLFRAEGLRPDDEGRLAAADEALAHRGPDGRGRWIEGRGRLLLMHRRLAIRDRAHGAQPYLGHARRTVLAYNGEVYNERALRRDLEQRGRRFDGTGDTEVLSALLEDKGAAGLDLVEGQYALACWDARDESLLLAVDANGEKPLLVAELPDGGLLFASEMRALLATGLLSRRLDAAGAALWVAMGHAPGPGTVLDGVQRMPPGAWWRFGANGRRAGTGHVTGDDVLPVDPVPRSFADAVDAVEAAVARAVESQMVSDRPLAVLLSGGVDSGLITALAARARPGVDTVTIAFRGSAFDETRWAAAVAARHGTTHEVIEADASADGFTSTVECDMDEPLADGAFHALCALCRAASRKAVVLLGGDGGDELFLGYDGWRADWRARGLGPFARGPSRLALAAWPRGARGHSRLARVALTESARARRLAAPRLSGRGWTVPARLDPAPVVSLLDERLPEGSVRGRSAGLEATRRWALSASLPAGLLVKSDRASMAASVELRSPLLDRSVRRLALALPVAFLADRQRGKKVLRAAWARHAPAGQADLPKMGLRPPFADWLRTSLRDPVRDALLDPAAPTRDLFEREGVAALLERHDAGHGDWHDEILTLWILDLWMRAHGVRAP
jgi:asparagine synthase (glutamine-hydrolysing)